jgi:hypothetical protein
MMLDLGKQDVIERRPGRKTVLLSPSSLHFFFVAAGKERICLVVQNGLEQMQGAKPVIQKHATLLVEREILAYEIAQMRGIGWRKPAILKQTHATRSAPSPISD